MKMQSLLKRMVAVGMVGILTVGMKPVSVVKADNAGNNGGNDTDVEESNLQVDVDFFDYNIREYDGTAIDDDMKIAWNKKVREVYSDKRLSQLFLFGGMRNGSIYGAQNSWTGRNGGQIEGIVNPTLDENGNVTFNNANGYYGLNLFPGKEEIADYNGLIEAYYDTNFKFYNDDGTYVFDSKKHAAYGLQKDASGNKGQIAIDFTKQGPKFPTTEAATQNYYGFYPFNAATGEDHEATSSRHDMFGMKMQFDFYMPENGVVGKLSNPEDKRDMVFTFTGDDDVWVFVDGKLVLDLGGIHDTVFGEVNFCTGDVTYKQQKSGGRSYNVKNIYESYGISKEAYSKHQLTMFFLERGEYDSNCRINFNIPTIHETDDISITKQAENVPENVDDTYEFQLHYGNAEDNLDHIYEGTYLVFDANNTYKYTKRTKDGKIQIKAGETAVVDYEKIPMGSYYQVKELLEGNRYATNWFFTNDSNQDSGNGTVTDVMVRNEESPLGSHIEFTNTYQVLTELALTKKMVAGQESTDAFAFEVTIGNDTQNVVLHAGDTKVFSDIPVGTAYRIAEVLTAGSVYQVPSVEIAQAKQNVSVKNGNKYVVEGVVSEQMSEGSVVTVQYTNVKEEATEEPTPTAEVTATPVVTEEVEPSQTPVATEEVEPSQTPVVTEEVEPSQTPVVTEEVKPSQTPVVTEEVKASATPVVTEEVKASATPVVTKEVKASATPAVTKEVKASATPAVTKEVKASATPVATKEVSTTELPNDNTEVSSKPEVTATATVVVPTSEVPNQPVAPTQTPTPTSNITTLQIATPDVPNSSVSVTTQPTEVPDETTELDSDVPSDPTTKKSKTTKKKEKTDETIIADDVPSTLPQTGEICEMAKKHASSFVFVFAIIAGLVTGIVVAMRRKKDC